MHIGLVVYGPLDTRSGGYLYDYHMVKSLRAHGNKVTVFSLPWRSYLSHLTDNVRMSFWYQLSSVPLDVLVQDELNHPSLAWGNRWLKRRVAYPVVSLVHHLRISENHSKILMGLYQFVEKEYLNSVDGFIVNSETTRCAVVSLLDQPRPFVVAYPGGNHIGGKAFQYQTGSIVKEPLTHNLLFVGNVIPRKGLHILIQALETLQECPWYLHIVGSLEADQKYAHHILQTIQQANMNDRVTVHGRVSDGDLVKLYEVSDILCVPSQYEGFGIVYLEAMAHGVIPIGSTEGAAHEIISDSENGFLVPPDDAEKLSRVLGRLMSDPDRMGAISDAALKRFEQHPSWEHSTRLIHDFLYALVN